MKQFYTFILLSLSLTSFTQLYINGVATDSIDRIQERAQDNSDKTFLNQSQLGFDSLQNYWANEIANNPSDNAYQNYYYSYVKLQAEKKRLKTLTDSDKKNINALEKTINEHLSENNNSLGMYYSLLSSVQGRTRKNIERSIQQSEKSIDIFKNNPQDNFNIISREYLQLSYLYKNLRDYDKAERLALISLDFATKAEPKKESSILYKHYALSNIYNLQHRNEEALKNLLHTIERAKVVFNPNHDFLISAYDLTSIIYHDLGEIDTALKYSFLALNIIRGKKGDTQSKMEKSYILISDRYREFGNNRLAQIYLDSALFLLKDSKNYSSLTKAYNTKSLLSRDHKEQINSLKIAMEYCKLDNWCSTVNIPIFLSNLGLTYAEAGDIQTALNYLVEAKNLKETDIEKYGPYLASNYSSIAIMLNQIDSLDAAIQYQQKAISLYTEYKGENSHLTASQISKLGNYLIKKGQYNLAEQYILEASPILIKKLGEASPAALLNLKHLSTLYEKQGRYQESLTIILKAYKLFDENEVKSEGFTNPYIFPVITLYQKLNHVDSSQLYLKKALKQTGYEDFNTEHFVLNSIPDYNYRKSFTRLFNYVKIEDELYQEDQQFLINKIKTLIDLTDKVRTQYFYETSEKSTQDDIRSFYNWAIHKLARQYQLTLNFKYLKLMFECIEKSKSLLIDWQYLRTDVINTKNMPEEIILREKHLVYQYEHVYNQFLKETSDSLKIKLEEKMYRIQIEKELFIDTLKEQYPNYYFNRYQQNTIQLEECQEIAIAENRTIAVFHWGDSILHKIKINPDTVLYRQAKIADIEHELIPLTDILTSHQSTSFEHDFIQEKSDFIKHSYHLFSLLLSDNEFDNNTNLTIIPDGKLNQLPFDVLLSHETETKSSYQQLPYLLKDHVIHYVGSVSHYNRILNNKAQETTANYKGFAPSYGNNKITDVSISRGEYNLNPLLYNTREVESASQLLNGQKFLFQNASETIFKREAPDVEILHLAMHTRINDRFPLETHLLFNKDTSSIDDGKLYVDELAKMNLNNKLVVLSACETNVGEQIAGEGILGIARAFQIALCPNIVLTNWLVDDKSSSMIMDDFFIGLKNKYSAAAALQKSKLSFLENCSTIHSHPKYWAAFSFYGNPNTSIRQDRLYTKLLYPVLCIGFLFLSVFSFKRIFQ